MRVTVISSLKSRLAGATKVAILGIGAELLADDSAGVIIARRLQDHFNKQKIEHWCAFEGGAAPENMTGPVTKFQPSHLIMIDAANFNKAPGQIELIELENIGGVSFSTHRLPTKIVADYLIKATGCKVTIIGIQPKCLNFCEEMSAEVCTAVDEVIASVSEAIQ